MQHVLANRKTYCCKDNQQLQIKINVKQFVYIFPDQ